MGQRFALQQGPNQPAHLAEDGERRFGLLAGRSHLVRALGHGRDVLGVVLKLLDDLERAGDPELASRVGAVEAARAAVGVCARPIRRQRERTRLRRDNKRTLDQDGLGGELAERSGQPGAAERLHGVGESVGGSSLKLMIV